MPVGVAYDGYLSECTIIFETSDDGHTAAFKPTTTVHGGLFSLPGYVAADLGNAYLQPAPRNITQTVTSDDAGICFDTALQMPEYLPLAAPPPSTCNNAIIISPLTSLLVYGQVYGLTADNVKTALGIPTSVALGTVDVLKVGRGGYLSMLLPLLLLHGCECGAATAAVPAAAARWLRLSCGCACVSAALLLA